MEVKPGYKQTEVGIIPEEWSTPKVSQLGAIVTGGTPRTQVSAFWNGNYPWVTPTDISAQRDMFTSERMLTLHGLNTIRRLPADSVLVTCIASIGKNAILKAEGGCNQQINAVIPNRDNNAEFLYYLFDASKQYLLANAGMTATRILSKSLFAEMIFPIPPLPEQRAIAGALSDVDALLGALDQLIAKQRDLKQAAMQQLLTGQTRLPGFHGEWQAHMLGEIGKFKNGLNKDSGAFGHGSPFVNLMDVFGVNAISSTNQLGLVASTKLDRDVYDLRRGDVLFIRSSVKPSGVGLTAVVDCDLAETVYSGFLIRFRDSGHLDLGFKKHCFYGESFRKRIIAASSVSANTNINQNALRLLSIQLPPTKAEQTAIAEVLTDMDAELAALEQRRAKTRALKQGMMQELLTGRTRLV